MVGSRSTILDTSIEIVRCSAWQASSTACATVGLKCTVLGAVRFSRVIWITREEPKRNPARKARGGGGLNRAGGKSCGAGLHIEQSLLDLEAPISKPLKLDLADGRRVLAPAGYAALLNSQSGRQLRLRTVVLNGFLCRHLRQQLWECLYNLSIGTPLRVWPIVKS